MYKFFVIMMVQNKLKKKIQTSELLFLQDNVLTEKNV